jgi:uncharacterized protein (TIGR03437 family)
MMSGMMRSLIIATAAWTLVPISVRAQFVQAFPRSISFVTTGYTLFPPDRPPAQYVSVAPAPFGVDYVPFRVREIRPTNLPTGVATDFVIISPSSGVAATQLSGLPSTRLIVALNPEVVPYMRPGGYHLVVALENPERPDLGATGFEVSLVLTSPGSPKADSIAHAASLLPGVSPGQVASVFGTNLSSPPIFAEADSLGRFPTVIGHTRVRVDGAAAPLLFVSNGRIDFAVPQAVAGRSSVEVIVDLLSPSGIVMSSPPVTAPVTDTSPGIFTADSSGSGPGDIENTGAGTGSNSESNPAPKGSAITLHATGAGAWNARFPDGSLVVYPRLGLSPPSPEFLAPLAPVSVTIGGQPAKLISATAQPMRVLGMLEVVVEIPEGVGSGPQPIVLKIGENDNAGQNVTVWVQ